ncbi:MAG TPA: hypothetical protein VHJ82_00330 [Actinomycetota bacterium]|nr:hypothetical protein [Actinomycetota bacterium]
MRIECDKCVMYQSEHCADCLVTALLHPPEGVLEIDRDLEPPLGALAEAGLIPVLKFRPRDGTADSQPASAAG